MSLPFTSTSAIAVDVNIDPGTNLLAVLVATRHNQPVTITAGLGATALFSLGVVESGTADDMHVQAFALPSPPPGTSNLELAFTTAVTSVHVGVVQLQSPGGDLAADQWMSSSTVSGSMLGINLTPNRPGLVLMVGGANGSGLDASVLGVVEPLAEGQTGGTDTAFVNGHVLAPTMSQLTLGFGISAARPMAMGAFLVSVLP